jgi:hypothetical protein
MYSYLGECGQPCTPWFSFVDRNLLNRKLLNKSCICIEDLPDSRYTLVSEGGDEGADEELQYVDVAQGLDQRPEGSKANLANEGKPRIINPVF